MFYLAHSNDRKGIAIVSEFCGCSSALTGIYKINPFNTDGVMHVLDAALAIPDREREDRFAKDYYYYTI